MRIAIVLLAVLWALPAQAQNLYVNNSGSPACSDATSKASNSAASPWCTINRAAKGAAFGSGDNSGEAASAGNTVHITCGTYQATASDESFYIALNPVNEGSSGSPIRFQAVANAADCIRITPHAGGATAGGSPIGSEDRDYIEWSGFTLNETDWPWDNTGGCCAYQNGQVGFFGDPATTGGLIERSTLTGSYVTGRDGDNYTGIRFNGAQATIRNNVIQDFGQSGHNNSCITSYFGVSIVIENNNLLRCGAGIYFKNNSLMAAGTSGHTVRYNYFEPNSYGIYCLQNCNGTSGTPVMIYQNIIVGGDDSCLMIDRLGGGAEAQDPQYVKFLSNVCTGQSAQAFQFNGPIKTAASLEYWNNIITEQALTTMADAGASGADLVTSKILYEHNLYDNFSTFASWQGIGTISLATWIATYAEDDTTPVGIDSDPLFVNPAADDYHLQSSGQAALTQGRAIYGVGGADGTTIPAGAYITGAECIGRDLDGDCEDPEPATAGPIRLRRSGL